MKFKGSNQINSSHELYYERANYANYAYPEGSSGPIMSIDFDFGETHLYGVVDKNLLPIFVDEQQLVPVGSGLSQNNALFCLPFVSDMLYDLKEILSKAGLLGCSTGNPLINNLTVYRAYESPTLKYRNYMTSIVQRFVNEGINGNGTEISHKIPKHNITDFSSFVKFFISWCDYEMRGQPLTFEGWMMSKKSSIFDSGMGISISPNIVSSVDAPKAEQMINTPEFEYFQNVLKQIGFAFDFNNPTTIFPDLGSPAIGPYLERYNLTNIEGIFNKYYNKLYNNNINIIDNILIKEYNNFVTLQQYQIKFNESCPLKTNWTFFERQQILTNPIKNRLSYYIDMKNIESELFDKYNLNTFKKYTKKIEKLFDISTAIDYIIKVISLRYQNKPFTFKDLARRVKQAQELEIESLGGMNDISNY